ncbi:MAG TPA: hypothetical protein V6C58_00745 [Allocoleopsis sp.]
MKTIFKVMSDSIKYNNGQYGFLCMAITPKIGICRYYAGFKSKKQAQQAFNNLERWEWGWEELLDKS